MSAREAPPAANPDSAADLRRRIAEFDWYHTQELAPGIVTPGLFDHRPYVDRYGIPADLSGKRVLEVGTFEGFWAFELERRGADVTAIDVDRMQQLDWPPRLRPGEDGQRGEGFAMAKEAFGSDVDRIGMSVYDATPEQLDGKFDLVFIGSVLIHLRDPMLALERLANLCRGELILCEEYSRLLGLIPLQVARFRAEAAWMVWWLPSVRTWLHMVRCAGFEDVREHARFQLGFRARRGGVRHVVIHARAPRGG